MAITLKVVLACLAAAGIRITALARRAELSELETALAKLGAAVCEAEKARAKVRLRRAVCGRVAVSSADRLDASKATDASLA